jgi:tRNA (cmo5U34)-methyltransferase
MSANSNNFNKIAPYYNSLSTIVFRKSIKESELYFLNKIPSNTKVLIIGGGTGWYLYELLKTNCCKKITYLEASSEMIRLTKKKIAALAYSTEIEFIEAPIEDVKLMEQFDVVVTNCVLDLFKEEKLKIVMKKIYSNLKDEGLWMFTDFKINKNIFHSFWQKILIAFMYAFFRATTKIETDKLLPFEKIFNQLNLKRIDSRNFYSGMIESVVYKKNV